MQRDATGRHEITSTAGEAVRREALLSSQIEGSQSSLSDPLLFELEEAPGVPAGDVADVPDT